MAQFRIRPLLPADAEAVKRLMAERWAGEPIVVRGELFLPHALPGFLAQDEGGGLLGLATWRTAGDAAEVITLDSVRMGMGVGTALLEAVRGAARAAGCRRLRLVTTNDNLQSLRFYQRRGFSLAALVPNALEQARCLKPGIPLVGRDGIPLRDELVLELLLGGPGS